MLAFRGGNRLKYGEVLRQWLDKWYGFTAGVISGYFFVDLNVIGEAVKTLKSGKVAKSLFKHVKGVVLNPETVRTSQLLLEVFSNEVILNPLLRNNMIAITVLESGESRVCGVGYGKEKWVCVFKTREKESKMIVANLLSILNFGERTYEFSGTRIFIDGLEKWLRRLFGENNLEYIWVRNDFEEGGVLPKDLNLIIRTLQNLFESPSFASSLMLFLDQKGSRGVWGMRYHDKISCVFSGFGGESYAREISETLAEVYDCYTSGLVKPEVTGIVEAQLGFTKEAALKAEMTAEASSEKAEAHQQFYPPQDVSELKVILEDLKHKFSLLEDRVSSLEAKLSSVSSLTGLGEMMSNLNEKVKMIDESISRVRELMGEFSEKLHELRRQRSELLRSIEDLSK